VAELWTLGRTAAWSISTSSCHSGIQTDVRSIRSPTEAPKVSQDGQQMILDFGGYCEVRIARGGELLTDVRYDGMKTNLFTSILGSLNKDTNNDPTFPKIGSRALVQGLDTTIVTFTTSDHHFDVEITALMHTPEMVESVAIAKDLSQMYDKR
jgi:hypothetical protein